MFCNLKKKIQKNPKIPSALPVLRKEKKFIPE